MRSCKSRLFVAKLRWIGREAFRFYQDQVAVPHSIDWPVLELRVRDAALLVLQLSVFRCQSIGYELDWIWAVWLQRILHLYKRIRNQALPWLARLGRTWSVNMQQNGKVDVQDAKLWWEHKAVDRPFITGLCLQFLDYLLNFLFFNIAAYIPFPPTAWTFTAETVEQLLKWHRTDPTKFEQFHRPVTIP